MVFKILIVDDSALMRDMNQAMIGELGDTFADMEFLFAADGAAAVRMTRTENPDFILMDVEMPYMNGIEACVAIRGFNKKVRIVLLTSLNAAEHFAASKTCGRNGYLTKPPNRAELKAHMGLAYREKSITQKQA